MIPISKRGYDLTIMATLGTINQIWRYPFKSMCGEYIDSCPITPMGVAGDRVWAVRDAQTGKLGSGKRLPALMMCSSKYLEEPSPDTITHAAITFPDGSTTQTDHDDVHDRLSEYLGKAVTIESSIGEHFDGSILSMQTDASIESLQEMLPESEIIHARFRHNLLIQTPIGVHDFPELDWVGKDIAVGDVQLTVHKPIRRCTMVSAPQPNLTEDQQILRTIIDNLNRCLGVYAITGMSGTLRVGDVIRAD